MIKAVKDICSCVHSLFTFGSLYFSRRHTLSVARSAFLCKKSASLSILKEKKTCPLLPGSDASWVMLERLSAIMSYRCLPPSWYCDLLAVVHTWMLIFDAAVWQLNDIIWTVTNQTSSCTLMSEWNAGKWHLFSQTCLLLVGLSSQDQTHIFPSANYRWDC